jgi:hypothetical protein
MPARRPVAKAVEMLEAKYGRIITYEDPRYIHPSDVKDVTLEVRRDLDKYKPGEAPKVLIPRGGALDVVLSNISGSIGDAEVMKMVQQILDRQAVSGLAGRFRVEKSENAMHVIPTAIKNQNGVLVSEAPVLDALISISAREQSTYDKMRSLCDAVSRATNVRVELGTVPTNLLEQHRDLQGANRQKARDVLISLLKSLKGKSNLSWQLFYDPGYKAYALNLHQAP